MDLQLKNKVIIVSDGAKDIGSDIVKVLAKEKAIPVIISSNEKENLKIIEEVNAGGGKCFHEVADLITPEACKESIYKIINQFGEVHGLINNTAINDDARFEHNNYENFMASLRKNLAPYYLLAHYLLPALIRSKGAIVNINFKMAETGRCTTSTYAANNGGINALTREWAVELLKYNIRVNAVVVESKTSLHDSKISPENRIAANQEIANTIAFLLSERSSHTTGQLIHADGDFIQSNKILQTSK